jgi:hypothetical protein
MVRHIRECIRASVRAASDDGAKELPWGSGVRCRAPLARLTSSPSASGQGGYGVPGERFGSSGIG